MSTSTIKPKVFVIGFIVERSSQFKIARRLARLDSDCQGMNQSGAFGQSINALRSKGIIGGLGGVDIVFAEHACRESHGG